MAHFLHFMLGTDAVTLPIESKDFQPHTVQNSS